MEADGGHDHAVRIRAFEFLTEQTARHGDVLPWSALSTGFAFDGVRVPLIGQQGIFKPAVLQIPLSIRTAALRDDRDSPYDDGLDAQGLLNYRYRGTDIAHRDNVGLRLAMERRAPLVYLFGVILGQYMPVWPVFVVGDDPADLCFKVTVDDHRMRFDERLADPVAEIRRSYITVLAVQRLHQARFRERVLAAYRDTCAICRLRHRELLEAAHILPDGHPQGEPIVSNGLALRKLHHAAFDAYIVGIRPDHVIEVRRDVLEEIDGPMLRHGLQAIAGTVLQLPRVSWWRGLESGALMRSGDAASEPILNGPLLPACSGS